MLVLLTPPPRPTTLSPGVVHAFTGMAALSVVLGLGWVVLFNSRSARWYFKAHSERPLAASLVACYLLVAGAIDIWNAVFATGMPILHWSFKAASAKVVFAAIASLEFAGTAAAWWKAEKARRAIAAFLGLYVLIAAWTVIGWWHRVRPGYHMINVIGVLVPVVALLLAARPWNPRVTVFPMDSLDLGPPDLEPPTPAGTLTRREIIRFSYYHLNRRNWPITLVAAVAIPLTLATLLTYGLPVNPVVQNLLPFVLLLLLWLLAPWWGAWRQHRKLQTAQERIAYRLDEFGVHAEGENFRSEIAWKLVHAVRETKTMFVIYQSSQLGWVIPKRFLPNGGVDAFRGYLERGLANSNKYHAPGLIGSLF